MGCRLLVKTICIICSPFFIRKFVKGPVIIRTFVSICIICSPFFILCAIIANMKTNSVSICIICSPFFIQRVKKLKKSFSGCFNLHYMQSFLHTKGRLVLFMNSQERFQSALYAVLSSYPEFWIFKLGKRRSFNLHYMQSFLHTPSGETPPQVGIILFQSALYAVLSSYRSWSWE